MVRCPSLLGTYLDAAYAEAGTDAVPDLTAGIHGKAVAPFGDIPIGLHARAGLNNGAGGVQCGAVRAPKGGITYGKLLGYSKIRIKFPGVFAVRHFASGRIQQHGFQSHHVSFGQPGYLRSDRNCSFAGAHVWSAHINPPYRHMHGIGFYQPHFAVETCAGIPAGRLFAVLKFHSDGIRTVCKRIGNIEMKGVVAVGPFACKSTVHIHAGFTHGAVEEECPVPARQLVHMQTALVTPLPHPGQPSATACLFACFGLAVLHHCYGLEVVGPVEGPVNRPVVGDADFLFAVKDPIAQKSLRPLGAERERQEQESGCNQTSHLSYVLKRSITPVELPPEKAP